MTHPSSLRISVLAGVMVAASFGTACGGDSAVPGSRAATDSVYADSVARARQDSINRSLPGYIVDSILPVEEELRRFRAAAGGDSATALKGGNNSLEALVRRFVAALASADTAELTAMVVHAREFSDLYYPDSPYSRAPYRQSPGLAWTMLQNPSSQGLKQLLRQAVNPSLTYVAHQCDANVVSEGRVRRHTGCLVATRDGSGTVSTRRLFGSVIERDGHFKFLSYTNQY